VEWPAAGHKKNGDDWLARGNDPVEQLLLSPGQTKVGTEVVLSGIQSGFAQCENHEVGLAGDCDGFVHAALVVVGERAAFRQPERRGGQGAASPLRG